MNHTSNENFPPPFSPTMSPDGPIPVPQDPLRQIHTTPSNPFDIIPQIVDVIRDYNHDNEDDDDNTANEFPESDELRTPGLRNTLNAETDNEQDDALLTPVQMNSGEDLEAARGQLSPLGLNVHSGLGSDNTIHVSDVEVHSSDLLPDTLTRNEACIPASLSQNLLLQPSLAPSGSFHAHSSPPGSPVPPSPSTIFSDTSMLSQLSTRVPSRLVLKANEYRNQARQEEQSRAVLDQERKTAEAQGKMREAFMLKVRLRELDDNALKLHEKAARRFYAGQLPFFSLFFPVLFTQSDSLGNNPLERCHKIDLHGLRPREAFPRAERALVKAIKEGRQRLYLIVGQGHHSINKVPVLKQTVQTQIIKFGSIISTNIILY